LHLVGDLFELYDDAWTLNIFYFCSRGVAIYDPEERQSAVSQLFIPCMGDELMPSTGSII